MILHIDDITLNQCVRSTYEYASVGFRFSKHVHILFIMYVRWEILPGRCYVYTSSQFTVCIQSKLPPAPILQLGRDSPKGVWVCSTDMLLQVEERTGQQGGWSLVGMVCDGWSAFTVRGVG